MLAAILAALLAPASAAAPASDAAPPAPAAKSPAVSRCLPPEGSKDPGPKSFAELRACQDKAHRAALRKARRKGRTLTADELEAVDEAQRSEARRFLAAADAPIQGPAPAPSSAKPAAAASKPSLGGATQADLSHLDPSGGAAVAALQARLQAAAGDGSQGITPDMAADIRSTLMQSQGGISPDMQALLDAVAHDGGKLTPQTMQLLQGAGKAAKSEGLDLNIDPEIEKGLLQQDFKGDEKYVAPQPGAAPAAPGSL
jgi:hypothetical protein